MRALRRERLIQGQQLRLRYYRERGIEASGSMDGQHHIKRECSTDRMGGAAGGRQTQLLHASLLKAP